MPIYVIVSTIGGIENAEGLFEAKDDAQAVHLYPQKIPKHLNNASYPLIYRRCDFGALEYRPRMARPQLGVSHYINMIGQGPLFIMWENAQTPLPHDANALSSSLNQLSMLLKNITDLFHSIEPDQSNMGAYGHLIRNTLLIAAMEFENECKGILRANGYAAAERLSTADFVKLMAPLRLDEYEVQLIFYAATPRRSPFARWSPLAPTQSLPWYDAYNAVKHDREVNFHRATIANALDAVTACAIMLAAQYRLIPNWGDQIGDFFVFTKHPQWPPEQQYIAQPWSAIQWNALPYSFT